MLRDPSFRRRLCRAKVDNIQSGCGHLHTAQISSQGCRLKTIKRKKKKEMWKPERLCAAAAAKQTNRQNWTDGQTEQTHKERNTNRRERR